MDGVRVVRFPYFYPYLGLRSGAKELLDKKGGNLFSFALMKALKKYPGLDLIHLHTGKRLGGIARHVAAKRGIPYIVSLHGGVFDVPAEEAQTWTEPTKGACEWGKALGFWVGSRRVLNDAAAIVCVGREEQVQTQKRFPGKKVIHLPNGVDTERFRHGNGEAFRAKHQIDSSAELILTVGRIDPQKNQLFAVTLLPDLLRKYPDVHMLFIGHVTNQSYHEKLTRKIEEAGVGKHVTVIAGLDAADNDLVDAYHAADLFLLPSIHEPFGIVILEAWAAGLPVVASRVGGIPSFVDDGTDGLLFEVNNAKECAGAIDAVLSNAQHSAALAEAGRAKAVAQYDWNTVTSQLVSIYEDAIREHAARSMG